MPQKWAADIKAVAENTNAYCKFSGLTAHAGDAPVIPRLSPVLDHVLRAFGPERLMFASDWPVMNETTDYKAWVDIAEKLLAEHEPFRAEGVQLMIYRR